MFNATAIGEAIVAEFRVREARIEELEQERDELLEVIANLEDALRQVNKVAYHIQITTGVNTARLIEKIVVEALGEPVN